MTTTVNYSWALPTVGASVNTWGTLLNAIIDDIDAKMFARTGGAISGNVSVAGVVSVGSAGTGATTSDINLDGSSAANCGPMMRFKRNGVTVGYLGTGSAVLGGSSDDLVLYRTTGGSSATLSPTGLAVVGTLAATAANTATLSLTTSGTLSTTGSNWISFRDTVERGYVGYGTGNSKFTISNTVGPVEIASIGGSCWLDANGNLLAGTPSGTEHTLQKSAPSNYAATISNSSTSNGYTLRLTSASAASATWNLIDGFASGTLTFRVSGNGDVSNLNNSYGAISSKEYKANIVDTTPKLAKLLKYRVVNYSLKDDPDQLKQIGLIWEELYEISPGLCEETPEFADVEIEPARTEIKVTQRQKTRTEESTRYEVLLVDGQWTKLPVRTEVQVPLFDLHPLFEQDGSPVMEVAEPAIEASPALYDKDGNEVTPSVEAKPAVMRQVMLQVPVMEDVQETVEIPAKTERRPTGKTIKSVKYSVLVPMLVKAMQEQQAQIEELKAKARA